MMRHGHARRGAQTPEWNCWRGMMERCTNPNHIGYRYYGARGITVCERWRDFANFFADMGPKPSPKHTIDRKENDKGYEPGNCRWATYQQQRLNQREYDEGARVQASWDGGNRSRFSRGRIDLTGQRFIRLLVIGTAESKDRRAWWKCRCDCGTELTVQGKALRRGHTKSCGCLSRDGARERALKRNAVDNPAKYRWG